MNVTFAVVLTYCGVRVHVILATFGTDGDVFPFLGLGACLVRRGHTVSLATCAQYKSAASEGGMQFHELLSEPEAEEVLANPDFWHPLKAGPLAAKWGSDFIPRQYHVLSTLARRERTVLVGNPGILAARLVHDKLGTPFASIILQPWIVPSIHKPPILPGGLALPKRAPRFVRRLYLKALSFAGDFLLADKLNRFRGELGLRPISEVLAWWLSPQLIIGLFPEWFGPRQPDWPKQIRLFSFPTFDGQENAKISGEIRQFLSDGEPPVAITFGTGIRHAQQLYQSAIEACVRLGTRAIVITKYPQQICEPLSPGIIATRFAPFADLFPRCSAILHHGGIGTTARALTANVPQLVVPICFDQLDNAERVKDLGGGSWVSLKKATPKTLSLALQSVLSLKVRRSAARAPDPPELLFASVAENIERMVA